MDPPFDEEQLQRLKVLRQQLYVGGAQGAAGGLLLGLGCVNLIRRVRALAPYRSRNFATLTMLLAPAIGVFVGSTVAGKNGAQSLTGEGLFEGNIQGQSSYVQSLTQSQQSLRGDSDASFDRRREHLLRQQQQQQGQQQHQQGHRGWQAEKR